MVKPVAVCGSEAWPVTEHLGEENIKEYIWTNGRTRNVANKK